MTGSEVAETATTFMGSGLSASHERRRFKFFVSLRCVVSCKGAATSLVPTVSPSSSVFVVVPSGCSKVRRLSVR